MKKISIPEGTSGSWSVSKFTITQNDLRAIFREGIPPGEYTRLLHHGNIVMSDTPVEMRDHQIFVRKAHGSVLINGLGLGMVLQAVLERPDVTKVTVNEISGDVINLVAPYYKDARLKINLADAYMWKPLNSGVVRQFDAIWHDIWNDISTDNLEKMTKLKRRYARWLNVGGYQACWKENFLRHQLKQDKD